jgi:L-amino acid N-acyltransferase YncA
VTELPKVLVKYKGRTLDAGTILAIIDDVNRVNYNPIPISHIEPKTCKGFVFAAERYRDCLGELKPLHEAHWSETEKHRHELSLNPNYDEALRMEDAGFVMLFTVRKDGELVGQMSLKIFKSMHSQTLVADEDSLFLRKDARGSLAVVMEFLRFVANSLETVDVREIRASSKLVNSADKLMIRAGFKPVAIQMVKMIGGAKHEG